jgi:hypothetical protein
MFLSAVLRPVWGFVLGQSRLRTFGTVIIGGGPAGMAVLFAAARDGALDDLLNRGLAIVESKPALGAGRLGRYAIKSDTAADGFLDCLRSARVDTLTALLNHPAALTLSMAGHRPAPLADAAELAQLAGDVLRQIIVSHPACAVFSPYTATAIRKSADGSWKTALKNTFGAQLFLTSANAVLATGAGQPKARLLDEQVGGEHLIARWGAKTIQSGDVLKTGGVARVARTLAGVDAPKIAIIGGGASAASVAHLLLTRLPPATLQAGAMSLLHRSKWRLAYETAEQALADGYDDFGPADICPVSGRVHRRGGLRLQARELIAQARGLGGRRTETRLHLHALQQQDPAAIQILDAADLIITAFGYRPNAIKVKDCQGAPVELLCHSSAQAPLVDAQCRVLDLAAKPLPGLFGIGLAAGFVPNGAGEPGFSGQVNELTFWQTAAAPPILAALLSNAPRFVAAADQYTPVTGLAPRPVRHYAELEA